MNYLYENLLKAKWDWRVNSRKCFCVNKDKVDDETGLDDWNSDDEKEGEYDNNDTGNQHCDGERDHGN